jgi:membrane-associated phospholipid phosphatase
VGAAVSLGVGLAVSAHIDETRRRPVIGAPPRIDRFFRDRLYDAGRATNFLDHRGTAYTLLGGVSAMLLLQQALDADARWRDGVYEVAVFGVGFLAQEGVKLAVKSSFARRRPELEFADPADFPVLNAEPKNHQSFYSGHAVAAFYTAAYADQRIGGLLRRRYSGPAGRAYRALSFLGLYGWAGYVGYSRMQIDRHYFTDVLAGAALGASWGIWHYRRHHARDGRWSAAPVFDGTRVGVMVSRRY